MANDAAFASALDSDEPWTLARLEAIGVRMRSVNVLAHGELRKPIDVKRLALLVRNADYKPRGFGALVLRFHEPKGSVLVYKSGKFIVIGAKSPANSSLILDKFVSVLQKVSYPHDVAKYTVANVINAIDLKFRLRLEGLNAAHIRHCSYEPELFPGLIYRLREPKVTLLVFISGKVVITGPKTQEDAERALCKMFPVFLQFRLLIVDDDEMSSSFSSDDDDGDDSELGDDGDDEGVGDDGHDIVL